MRWLSETAAGTVEDCARVVEFLATDLFDYVTGAVIPLDSGLERG
jgi:3-oxoacyl-[acyl-carrier protein] reductase